MFVSPGTGASSVACVSFTSLRDLHRQFGHSTLPVLKKLVLELDQVSSLECESCQMGKHYHMPYLLRVDKRVHHPFELVHSDIWRLVLLVQDLILNISLSL